MDKEIKKGIKSLLSKIESTERFILDQAPEVCKQLVGKKLLSEKIDTYIYGTSTLVLIAISVYSASLSYLSEPGRYGASDKQIGFTIAAIISGIIAIPLLCATINSIKEYALTAKYTKVFLINQFRNML